MGNDSEYKEHLKPGDRVWIKVWDPDSAVKDDNGDAVFVYHGGKGDFVYTGYQHVGTATFLLFATAKGSGKKTQLGETTMFNAIDVRHIGHVVV